MKEYVFLRHKRAGHIDIGEVKDAVNEISQSHGGGGYRSLTVSGQCEFYDIYFIRTQESLDDRGYRALRNKIQVLEI